MADVKLLLGKLVKKNVTKDQITPDFPNYELQLKENENCFIFGPVGTGKTVLLKDMVEEAIIAKHPCLVIDPKGDLAQLAWLCDDASTQALVAASFVPQDVFQDYRKQYERFGILDRPQLYGDSVHVQLLDHNFKPDSNAIKRLFEIRTDGRTPLTICYLHLTNSDRAKQAVLNLLRSIEAAKDELSKTEGMKFLFIDEAHRFNNDKAPDVYNALRLILREECRPVKLTVVMSTQKLNDFELQELKASSFKHFFEFENMNYNCKVLGPNEVGKPNQKPPSQYLHPRWTLTVHRQEPMKLPEIERTMSLRNIQTHRINPDLLKPDLTGYPKNNALEEMDWKILSCLNDIPFSVEWNPKPLENVMGSDFRSQIAEALEFLKTAKN